MTSYTNLKGYLICWGPAVLWMAFIFFLSAQPGLGSSELRSEGFAWTAPLRSTAHFGLYFILSLLLQRALGGGRPSIALTILISTICAALDEFQQSFVPGRAGRAVDAAIDMVGAVSAVIVVAVLRRLAPFLFPVRSSSIAGPLGDDL